MNRIKRYYAKQASRGVSCSSATIWLPVRALSALKGNRRSVFNGFGLYSLPLLASYSRCGTNWIRYIVEYISGYPTPGQERLVKGNDYVLDRAHRAFPIMKLYPKVILVVRDYKECILRHHSEAWVRCGNVEALLSDDNLEQPPIWYIKNLEAFDAYEGEKLLLYYEDLCLNPKESIVRLSAFLGLDRERTDTFLGDIDSHYRHSVNAYKRGGHNSETSDTKNMKYHATNNLTAEQVKEFDNIVFGWAPHIANRYLRRYLKPGIQGMYEQ